MSTRAFIIEAARPLFDGGGEPRVAEIAAAAGVSRATFHRVLGSRQELLRELELEPGLDARQRVLAAAIELLAGTGLGGLSMDELAAAAGVSRAGLYRLFPGKPALFRELVRVYSPMEAIAATIERLGAEPPEVVMPEVARVVVREVAGRMGMVRALIFEVTGRSPDAGEGLDFALSRGLGMMLSYIGRQTAAGRLRPLHPVLALQAFVGPVLFHLITRGLVEERLGFDLPLEAAAGELAAAWVRAMRPPAAEEDVHER